MKWLILQPFLFLYSINIDTKICKTYYERSNKLKESFECLNEDQKHGKYFLYWENGKLYRKGQYKNNQPHDTFYTYFENDSIETINIYRDGNPTGIWEYRYKEGTLQSKYDMSNSKQFNPNLINSENITIKYPNSALENDITGTVTLLITLDSVCNCHVTILKDIGHGCGQAAKNGVIDYFSRKKSARALCDSGRFHLDAIF